MKAIAKQRFRDLKVGCIRNRGEVFDCTQKRYEELEGKLPAGYVSKVQEAEPEPAPAEDKPKKTTKKKAAKK